MALPLLRGSTGIDMVGLSADAPGAYAEQVLVEESLMFAVPNGLTVEYMGWMLKLFAETPRIEKGEMILTDKPGFGIEFDKAAVARFTI